MKALTFRMLIFCGQKPKNKRQFSLLNSKPVQHDVCMHLRAQAIVETTVKLVELQAPTGGEQSRSGSERHGTSLNFSNSMTVAHPETAKKRRKKQWNAIILK